MSRRLGLRLAICLLVGIGVVAADIASVRASMMPMACCTKTKGECAGVKSPDDCCRGMGHAAAGPTTNTPQSKSTLDSPALLAVLTWTARNVESTWTPVFADSFKRPHDPPHLHTFALLI